MDGAHSRPETYGQVRSKGSKGAKGGKGRGKGGKNRDKGAKGRNSRRQQSGGGGASAGRRAGDEWGRAESLTPRVVSFNGEQEMDTRDAEALDEGYPAETDRREPRMPRARAAARHSETAARRERPRRAAALRPRQEDLDEGIEDFLSDEED